MCETLWQTHIFKTNRLTEQRGDFFVAEAGNAAADACYIEEQFGMLFGENYEIVHVGLDGFYTTLHGGYGIALATKTYTASHYGAELLPSCICGTAAMHTCQVAAKHKDFIGLQFRYHVRGKVRTLYSVVSSHCNHEDTKKSKYYDIQVLLRDILFRKSVSLKTKKQKGMNTKPHWSPDADFSSLQFFIRRMDTAGYFKPAEAPVAQLPLVGFIYITSGEVLVDVDGIPFLCQSGQILLIPQRHPFIIRYYRNAVGYTGGFAPSSLPDSKPLRYLSSPLHQGFWFDEGTFMAELFNMLASSFEKGDSVFVEKGLDLLLSRIKPNLPAAIPAAVSSFLELVFDPDRMPGTIAFYAEQAGISENYLSRLVKQSTGRSVGAWIDIVRIQRAKRLLSSTDLPVIDIAVSVGVEDQSYFSRLFRKETGITPSAFRKKMQG